MISKKPYEAWQIYNGVWVIDQDFVRSFLVEGEKEALLIDTCDAHQNLKELVDSLTEKPYRVALTHADTDHIGAAPQFDMIHLHPADDPLLRSASKDDIRVCSMHEGDVFDLGGRRLEVIFIPGHTPGSVAFLDRNNRILFSGDSVKQDTVYAFGEGRNLGALIDSLQRLWAMRDSYDKILPSHGALPVAPAIILELIEGAQKLDRGELVGADDGCGMPCLLYIWKSISFYY